MNLWLNVFLGFLIIYGYFKKVDIYNCFIAGAQDGLRQGLQLIPYFLAIMFPVYLWNNLGITSQIGHLLAPLFQPINLPEELLPLMLLRPLSGGAALGIFSDIIKQSGPDSFAGVLASVYQGGTDTTFFVITVYFGAVNVRKYRYALKVGLLSDLLFYVLGLFWVNLLFR